MAIRRPVVSVPEGGNPTLGLEQIPAGDTVDPAVLPPPVIPAHDTTGPTGTGPEFEHYNTAERGIVDAEVIASAAHRVDTANPHAVSAAQAGADPAGTAAIVQGNLNTHEADAANPHTVSFSQAVAADGGTDITAAEAETLTDGSNADALHVHAGGGGGGLPGRVFEADQLESPNSADWAVNALAALVSDSNNTGINIRPFDDTAEEGVGFKVQIPSTAANVVISLVSRAETAPPAVRTIGPKLYKRAIPDNAVVVAWSNIAMADISLPANEFFQYDSETFTLAALGVTAGSWYQFELTRVNPAGGTELVGDWDLMALKVDFT